MSGEFDASDEVVTKSPGRTNPSTSDPEGDRDE
jgi:hypothetical protein